ncbi:MAG: hypothetical protein IPI97_14315 [Nitrosomonas sp.]|nr:hypothetical protein [Nitrosomonas sp.]
MNEEYNLVQRLRLRKPMESTINTKIEVIILHKYTNKKNGRHLITIKAVGANDNDEGNLALIGRAAENIEMIYSNDALFEILVNLLGR